MNQFRNSKYFSFNGYDFTGNRYKIISNNIDLEATFGLNKSVEVENIKDTYITTKIKNECITIPFCIVKFNKYENDVEEFSEEEYEHIIRKLFINDDGILKVNDLNYKGVFTSATINELSNMISLEFQMTIPYCFRDEKADEYIIRDRKDIYIIDNSNSNEKNYIDVEFIGGSSLLIRNKTNDSKIELYNLIPGYRYKVFGDIKQIMNLVDKKLVYSKDFLYLDYGKNEIEVVYNGNVKFIYKDKLGLR